MTAYEQAVELLDEMGASLVWCVPAREGAAASEWRMGSRSLLILRAADGTTRLYSNCTKAVNPDHMLDAVAEWIGQADGLPEHHPAPTPVPLAG